MSTTTAANRMSSLSCWLNVCLSSSGLVRIASSLVHLFFLAEVQGDVEDEGRVTCVCVSLLLLFLLGGKQFNDSNNSKTKDISMTVVTQSQLALYLNAQNIQF